MLIDSVKKLVEAEFPDKGHINISIPEVKDHGHFSTNFAFVLAKSEKISPMEAAEKIKDKVLEKDGGEMIDKVEVVAPGFVNFWIKDGVIQNEFSVISKSDNWGRTDIGNKQTIIVEYSSPNIAKPMHVGHFRSTIIGDAIANLYEAIGYDVIRWNYIGDWGVQFGKLIYAYNTWGDEETLKEDPIKHLLALYVRFTQESKTNPELEGVGQEEFKKLEEGDEENRKLWEKFRKVSIKEFDKVYEKLGVKFDIELGESFYEDRLKPLIKDLQEGDFAERSEGALIINLEKYDMPPALIEKSDGASLYFTRELANLKYRVEEYKPEKIVYVVGLEQSLHFKQLFKVASMLGFDEGMFSHVGNGLVLGADGKKLSTREGKTIFIDDVLRDAEELTRKMIDEKSPDLPEEDKNRISELVAIGALKYNDLSQNRTSDITFEWERMLNFEGDSGPYLQYTYARLKGILRKTDVGEFDVKNLTLPIELEIIMKLDMFPEVIKYSAETFYSNHLAKYLYDLAQLVNRFYQEQPVLKAESGVSSARLNLIKSVSDILKKGLNLLGIEALERM